MRADDLGAARPQPARVPAAAREPAASRGFDDREFLRTRGGEELVVHLRRPSDGAAPRAVVLLAHGAGEHARRYGAFADALAEAGFAVVAPDQLGHGETGRRAGRLGRLGRGGNRRALGALVDVAALAADRFRGAPLVLFGHSWGSLLGQRLLAKEGRRVAAAIFSGSTLALPGWLNPGRLNARFEPDPTGLQWLTRDAAARDAFAADPDCFDIAETPVWSATDSLALLSRPRRAGMPGGPGDVPILVMSGSEDPLGYGVRGPRALARAFRRRGGHSDVTLRIYDGARHETLNETNAPEVRADVVAWLDRRFPRA